MLLLAALRNLPVSLFISSLALASSALPVHTIALTPENFHQSVSEGVWFIEHFSPYCSHCRDFAPTWAKLVEENESDVQMAQVNCAVHGDLCTANGVKGYPHMTLFKDGEIVEHFTGSRDLDRLAAFIKRHVPAEKVAAPPPTPNLNTDGTVLELSTATFGNTLAHGPAFVKFFAPWCGHCKKLAPTWKQLARHMQDKLTIAEINCDDHSSLCKEQGIKGYPTLVYFQNGVKSEYNGGRKLEQLKAFTEKASAVGLRTIKAEELDAHVAENDVVYLLLHSASDTQILETVREASTPLLGDPLILTSSSSALFTRFSIPSSSTWALLVLKDHDAATPSSIFHGSTSAISKWLLTHRIPSTLELTRDTFQSVMNAPHAPLVVIAAVTAQTKARVEERFRDVSLKWRVRTGGSGRVKGQEGDEGREVVFTWMDAERWADWMKSMYAIKKTAASATDNLDDVRVVIADHSNLIYYDVDSTDAPIKFTSSSSIFSAIEGAVAGKIIAKNSESFVERLARYLNNKLSSLETYVVTNPLHVAFFVVLVFVFIVLAIRRIVADDPAGEKERNGKSGRLD